MDEKGIRSSLYIKMENEYNQYIENLKLLKPEEIISKAYETTMKEETVSMFYPDFEKFDIEDVKCLLKRDKPLEELYDGWMDSDINLNELYEDSIRETIDNISNEENEKKKQGRKKELER